MIEGNVHYYVITFFTILVLVIILIALVVAKSIKEHRRKKKEARWLLMIDQKISSVIIEDPEESETQDSIVLQGLLSNRKFRELFLWRLVQAEKKFAGSAQTQILELFQRYELKNEALRKIESSKDYAITQGVQELRSMNVQSALPLIQKLATHRSTLVRQEAQLALVHFKGFEGLNFLSEINWNISKWHQLRLSLALNEVKMSDPSKIQLWLKSTQPSVVIFSLELMRKYQTLSLYDKALAVLMHSDIEVQIQAVRTLVYLENDSTFTDLINTFPSLPEPVQKTILAAMAVTNEPEIKDFLKFQFTHNPSSALQLEAAKSLERLGERPFLENYVLNPSQDSLHSKLAKHTLDIAS